MITPIDKVLVDGLVAELGIEDFAKATIREVKQVAAKAEKASGVEFIKMEMGIPGLPAAQVGVDAQIKALEDGIAHSYPDIQGAPVLKEAASQFVKAFIGVDIKPEAFRRIGILNCTTAFCTTPSTLISTPCLT